MGLVYGPNKMQASMHKGNDVPAEHIPEYPATLSSFRTMVAYRDGKIYMGSPRKMAHVRYKQKMPNT